ncbi:hypothetical protein BRD00_03605 [Halobacteriales archaeon QS_8_69_26]|nr:MAG: hypothetical protein BRD00_03605 [Halobacteriales archaeon QS_8_69_26]
MVEPDVEDEPSDSEDDAAVPLVVFSVLGAGFVALFLGQGWFWMVWVLGFAVLLPMVAVLSDHYGPFLGGSGERKRSRTREVTTTDDEDQAALETLKQRYAAGEIDEEEFERRLERLVENERIEDVERRHREKDRDPEFET